MHHFFVNQDQIEENIISIIGSDVNHIKNVLRMKINEQVLISNGRDKDYLCSIDQITCDEVILQIISVYEEKTELPAKIYLFQGLPKSDKMELIIQKAVELGVYEIIPVAMKNSVVKLDEKKAENKIKRWQTISESAAKQSKRMLIPKVEQVMTFKEALDYARAFEYNLIPYENARGMQETKELIGSLRPNSSIGVFIGPEGGFDNAEIELALSRNMKCITLGKRILRTETAGLAALSVIMFQLEK
ncbi:16S rRNA (uracil1498-N3)-methyltransferase [Lachnotalea glycerini]|uniref:Ribosomal RNA small subunit methyltransferase E n=1 Tax=Lachnotalea glycerini TaxID=1763509 RepID=A0A255KTL5_9FIRM|nr:16S rRNA (uracil(1498)-N(3))-methyltransferase [Lachnotalea glycerini]OYO67850.1 16S rRNA (uracil(1498)-N(3))-methyltransferase [Lachnotalea glycerini]PXV93479.1 16S rRNA (uracil1498-N3)-methyltransferase [Lachnotalea glycerini]RDY32443.1 16S rRNA (uracil(1498)-N(3))-methyltransferase [Lachnotalea glycerini]